MGPAPETPDAAPAIAAARWLRDASRDLAPGGTVQIVYHPLTYAWPAHEAYLSRFATGPKKALMVGMNPGAWGMGQTGVPFGDVELVGDWLGLRGATIGRPDAYAPKRPVDGWACTRREASGKRLWGLMKDLFGTGERALRDLLIINHCPLLMFTDGGQNITPDKLRKADREAVFAVCDEGVARMARALRPDHLIGVGAYAEGRCQAVVDGHLERDVAVHRILHPSPASPLANREGGAYWRRNVEGVLRAAEIL